MSAARTLALLGGPDSGKTTYISALINGLEEETITSLRIAGSATDQRGWDQLAAPLIDAQYPQRTKKAERQRLDIHLKPSQDADGQPFTLQVGDYAGEEVEDLFRNRIEGWSQTWREYAQANGLIIFVRETALRTLPHPRFATVLSEQERWAQLAGQPAVPSSSPPTARTKSTLDDPKHVFAGKVLADSERIATPQARPSDPVIIPTVLAIIELLQFIRYERGWAPGEHPPPDDTFRIGLVATAWDAVNTDWQKDGAAAYFGERLPLLEDFLHCNFAARDVYRFGLSATGGNLEEERYREAYQDENRRGYVTWRDAAGQQARSPDISIPLQWALFGDRALRPDPA